MSASIIIIDDSETVRLVARDVLVAAGYQVDALASAEAALALARHRPPRLFLVDINLREMTGIDFCHALAADTVLRDTPVVLMAGRGDPLAERLHTHLPNALLEKPFSPEALRHIVGATLMQRAEKPSEKEKSSDDLTVWAAKIAAAPAQSREALLRRCLEAHGFDDNVVLSGDLSAIGVAELFQMLTLQEQTGVFSVENDYLEVDIYFCEGKIDFVFAERTTPSLLLGRILVAEGFVDKDDLDQFLRYRRRSKLLGHELVALGFVTIEELRQALARQSSELVYELVRTRHGRFRFTRSDDVPRYAAEFRLALSTDALLMEGYRRVDELKVIEAALQSRRTVLLPDSYLLEKFGHQNLTAAEQEMMALCNGQHSIEDILRLATPSTFDSLKIIYRLLESRLVHPAAPALASAEMR